MEKGQYLKARQISDSVASSRPSLLLFLRAPVDALPRRGIADLASDGALHSGTEAPGDALPSIGVAGP